MTNRALPRRSTPITRRQVEVMHLTAEGLSLSGEVVFNEKEVDPFGWGIGQRVAAGAIRAGSVGFLVHKVEIQEAGGESRLIFRAQELLEFSLCNVPSNPYALHQGAEGRTFTLPPLPEGTGEGEIKRFWQSIIQGQ